MCGIAGICALGEKTLERSAKSTVQGMIDSLIHRGPDGGGICMYPSVCLGHRRLSIIDLSKGAQPMTSHDGCATIVFNGEIYNFPELKKTLQQKGARFISDSDTEVILEAYRVWGTDCLNAFEGMFAFALYDHWPVTALEKNRSFIRFKTACSILPRKLPHSQRSTNFPFILHQQVSHVFWPLSTFHHHKQSTTKYKVCFRPTSCL